MWFHGWGLEHVKAAQSVANWTRRLHRTGAAMGKLFFVFSFKFETAKKKNTPSVFQRQNRGYPKAKTDPNSHANTPSKCFAHLCTQRTMPCPTAQKCQFKTSETWFLLSRRRHLVLAQSWAKLQPILQSSWAKWRAFAKTLQSHCKEPWNSTGNSTNSTVTLAFQVLIMC